MGSSPYADDEAEVDHNKQHTQINISDLNV